MKPTRLVLPLLAGALLLIPMTASAQESTWNFDIATGKAAAEKKIEAGIEDAISEMNFVVRSVARGRLTDTNAVCTTLTFKVSGKDLSIQCNKDGKVFTTPMDGTARDVTGSDNKSKYKLTQKLEDKGDKVVITQHFKNDEGQRITIYTYDPKAKTLSLSAQVKSPKLDPKSLKYTLPYKQK